MKLGGLRVDSAAGLSILVQNPEVRRRMFPSFLSDYGRMRSKVASSLNVIWSGSHADGCRPA